MSSKFIGIKNMKYSCLLALIFFFSEFCQAIVRQRCTAGHSNDESGSIVSTQHGKVLGLKETKIDPRQNKSVTWTSYFVTFTNTLHWSLLIMIVAGYSIRRASDRRSEISCSSSSPRPELGLRQGRSEYRGPHLSSGQRQV